MNNLLTILLSVAVVGAGVIAGIVIFVNAFVIFMLGFPIVEFGVILTFLVVFYRAYKQLLFILINHESNIVRIFSDLIILFCIVLLGYFLNNFLVGPLLQTKNIPSDDFTSLLKTFFIIGHFLIPIQYIVALTRAYRMNKNNRPKEHIVCVLLSPMVVMLVILGPETL